MAKDKPRTTHTATEARKAVIGALTSGRALPEPEARELVDRLAFHARGVGYSERYDEGHAYTLEN